VPYVPTNPGEFDATPRQPAVSRREADALASMMGADSRRVDALVGDVGAIKGDVQSLKHDTGRIGTGVEQLQQSMAILNKHAVLMETQTSELNAVRTEQRVLDGRVRAIETTMPALTEARMWVTRGMLAVLTVVLLAVVGLVLKGTVP
jgi:hypothetical protein